MPSPACGEGCEEVFLSQFLGQTATIQSQFLQFLLLKSCIEFIGMLQEESSAKAHVTCLIITAGRQGDVGYLVAACF